MNEFKYELKKIRNKYDLCITKCPYEKDTHVGSIGCQQCKWFESRDSENKTVKCNRSQTTFNGKCNECGNEIGQDICPFLIDTKLVYLCKQCSNNKINNIRVSLGMDGGEEK